MNFLRALTNSEIKFSNKKREAQKKSLVWDFTFKHKKMASDLHHTATT